MLKKEEVLAEDINAILCGFHDVVETKVELSDAEQDQFWEKMQPVLEEFFGCPQYRHYN